MHARWVRGIEYEVVPVSNASRFGLPADAVVSHLSAMTDVAVLRCVDADSQKLTAFGDGQHFQALLAGGEARHPAGMKLSEHEFPVVVAGWRYSS